MYSRRGFEPRENETENEDEMGGAVLGRRGLSHWGRVVDEGGHLCFFIAGEAIVGDLLVRLAEYWIAR
jgi:hypothetical protein